MRRRGFLAGVLSFLGFSGVSLGKQKTKKNLIKKEVNLKLLLRDLIVVGVVSNEYRTEIICILRGTRFESVYFSNVLYDVGIDKCINYFIEKFGESEIEVIINTWNKGCLETSTLIQIPLGNRHVLTVDEIKNINNFLKTKWRK